SKQKTKHPQKASNQYIRKAQQAQQKRQTKTSSSKKTASNQPAKNQPAQHQKNIVKKLTHY
ncbi:hypothetical protein, partial [Arcanobacterium haemolyticum]